MFAIPTIAALLLFVYFRPHDIFEALKPLTFNLIAGLLAWGLCHGRPDGVRPPSRHAAALAGVRVLGVLRAQSRHQSIPLHRCGHPDVGCLPACFSPDRARATQLQSPRGDRRRSSRHHLGDSHHRRTSGPVPVDLRQVLPDHKSELSPTAARAQTRQNQSNVVWEGPRTSGTNVNIPASSTRTRFKDEFAIEAFFKIPTSSPGRCAWGRRWPSRSTGASAPRSDS